MTLYNRIAKGLVSLLLVLPGIAPGAAEDKDSSQKISANGEGAGLPRGYVPPMIGNGSLCLLVDYEGSQSQCEYAKITPGIAWAGRRYGPPNDKMVPYGHFEQTLAFNGQVYKTPSRWTQTLNTKDAAVISKCDYGDLLSVESTAFVPYDHDIIVIKKRFVPKSSSAATAHFEFKYVFSRPRDLKRFPRRTTAEPKLNAATGGIDIKYQVDGHKMYDGVTSVFADRALTPRIETNVCILAGDIPLDAAKPVEVTFFISFADSVDGNDYRQRAERLKAQARSEGFAGLFAAHRAQWVKFWNESYVRIPDARLEQAYYTAQYHLKVNATRWSFPVGIFHGSHWEGRYFGWDEMFCYLGLASGNHLSTSARVPEFRHAVLKPAMTRTLHYGQPESFGARYPWETLEDGSEGAPPGFWIEHIFHMSNIAVSSWFQYLYNDDIEYLKSKGYPVIKECATYYFRQMIYESPKGGLIVGKCTDLERIGPARLNPFMTSCGVIFTLEAASKAAAVLKVDEEQAREWKKAAASLRKSLPRNAKEYVPYDGCPDGSIAVLGGTFPYPVLDPSDPLQKNAIYGFIRNRDRFGNMYPVGKSVCGWYGGWMAVALAALGDKTEPAKLLSQVAEGAGCFGEMFEINEEKLSMRPWFSTAAGNLTYALDQMLVQSRDEQILIAPAVPAEWKDFSFELPCYGNITATVSAKNGRITQLVLNSPDTAKSRKRTIVVPSNLLDEQLVNKGAVASAKTRNGCSYLKVEFKGKSCIVGGR